MSSPDPLRLVLWCLGAFLAGSIPFGLVLVKLAGKGDVRAHGSGNIGATNVSRVGGKALGIVTLLLDILKGWLPVWLCARYGPGGPALALVALAAVLGHVFTPWLKFQGGKGVATTLGAALAFQPGMVLPSLGIFVAVLLLTRFVSLGSVLGAVALPVAPLLGRTPGGTVAVVTWTLVALIVIAKHHENLRRLLQGTEARLWGGPKPVEAPHA
jgi:acyl phosphate:glycerol-3-phosphate acyltransferase